MTCQFCVFCIRFFCLIQLKRHKGFGVRAKGLVKYIGPVGNSINKTEIIGVELQRWHCNGRNGTYNGLKYFSSPDGRGLIITRDDIADVETRDVEIDDDHFDDSYNYNSSIKSNDKK